MTEAVCGDAPVCQGNGPISQRLRDRVVAFVLVRATTKHHKLLGEIAVQERKEGYWWEDDVGHQGLRDFGEAFSNSKREKSPQIISH